MLCLYISLPLLFFVVAHVVDPVLNLLGCEDISLGAGNKSLSRGSSTCNAQNMILIGKLGLALCLCHNL